MPARAEALGLPAGQAGCFGLIRSPSFPVSLQAFAASSVLEAFLSALGSAKGSAAVGLSLKSPEPSSVPTSPGVDLSALPPACSQS